MRNNSIRIGGLMQHTERIQGIQRIILRIGSKYNQAPKSLRVTIGEILEGKIKIGYKKKW